MPRYVYRLMPVLILPILALASSPPPASAGSATYCISGSSTGIGWVFALECASGNVSVGGGGVVDGAIPSGSGCAVLAEAFVDLTNLGVGGWTATPDPNDPCCFTITHPDCPTGNILLTVFTTGLPPCTVTPTTPCTFNPTISMLGPVSVDGSTWGRVKSRYRGR